MAQYEVPGVYVEVVPTGPKPMAAASMSVAAALGIAPKADAYVDAPRECNNWPEFVRDFMPEDSKPTPLAYAVYGYFMNGGRRLYVVNVGASGTIAGDARKGTGIHALLSYPEPSMVFAPGYNSPADCRALLDHAEKCGDRIAIIDGPESIEDTKELTEVATVDSAGGEGEGGGRRTAKSKAKRPPDSKFGVCYFPWIKMSDPFGGKEVVSVPPSGHMAGIYAMNDYLRGVHKAPANYAVRTAIGLSQRLTPEQHGVLNTAGVNVIRFFGTSGIRVWGARTLSTVDREWMYVNVERIFIMVQRSLIAGTNWVVFEPNDQNTRNFVARDCRAFLKLLWLDGALVGATPEQAFFVKCDAENNPPEVVDAGRLIVDIGIAPSKPAEFIVFRIGQWSGGTEVQAA